MGQSFWKHAPKNNEEENKEKYHRDIANIIKTIRVRVNQAGSYNVSQNVVKLICNTRLIFWKSMDFSFPLGDTENVNTVLKLLFEQGVNHKTTRSHNDFITYTFFNFPENKNLL